MTKNNPSLFTFQEAIVQWAYDRERAAIFADCGLGKTPMQLAWLRRIAHSPALNSSQSITRHPASIWCAP